MESKSNDVGNAVLGSGPPPASRRSDTVVNLAVLGTALLSFGLISLRLRQDANFDLLNYHYYNGWAALHHRWDRDIHPAQVQTYLNPLIDMPVYVLMQAFPARVVGFLLGALHGLSFWLVYLIGRLFFARLERAAQIGLALACAIVAMYAPAGGGEIGVVMHDLTVSPLVLAGFLILCRARPPGANRRWPYLLAGLLYGSGVGAKMTFVLHVVGFVAMIATEDAPWATRLKRCALWSAGTAFGFLATAGWWMAILWDRFESPFFPFYNSLFRSPYYLPVNWPPGGIDNPPRDWAQLIFLPFYMTGTRGRLMTMELRFRDLRLAVIYVLFLAVAAVTVAGWLRKRRPSNEASESDVHPSLSRGLLAFFLSSYLAWEILFSVYRYGIVLEQIAPVMIVTLVGKLVSHRGWARVLVAFLFAGILAAVKIPNWKRTPWGDRWLTASVPTLPAPERSVVVITSESHLSYVLPSFPLQATFVRIQCARFFKPEDPTRLAEEVTRRLSLNDRDFYLLTRAGRVQEDAGLLARYRLEIVEGTDVEITTNLEKNIRLWRLRRMVVPREGR